MQHTLSLCVPSRVQNWQALALESCPRDEHERADRFAFEALRRRFLCGRAMLRHLLAEQLGRAPCDVRLDKTAKGQLIAPESGMSVSLSYSEDLVGVLIGDGPLGLDLEYLDRTNDLRGVARHAFRPEEQASMTGLQGGAERNCFFRIWCEKEAVSKAMGTGMSIGFNSFDPRASAAELGLHVHTFPLHANRSANSIDRGDPKYLACIVIPQKCLEIQLLDWNRAFETRELRSIPGPASGM